jgi:putative membrane protein
MLEDSINEPLNTESAVDDATIANFHGESTENWHRMSAWSIIFLIWKLFKGIFISNWPTLVAIFVFLQSKSFSLPWIVGGAGVTTLILFTFSLINYLRFRFFWDEEHLFIQSGIFTRKLKKVPFERIQSVNTSQSLVHRLLGLVSVTVDTAGSAAQEVQISAVSVSFADNLSQTVYEFRQQMAEKKPLDSLLHKEELAIEQDERIAKVDTSDVLIYALFENHLKTAGLILAFVLTIFQQVNQAFEDAPAEFLEQQTGNFVESFKTDLVFALVTIAVLSMVITILFTVIRMFLQNYNTELYKTSKGYRKVSGLLTRKKVELGVSKVQMIAWKTNPLKKFFGLYGFKLSNASTQVVNPGNLTGNIFFIPAMRLSGIKHTIARVLERAIPEMSEATKPVSTVYIFRQTLYFGVIPFLIALGPLLYFEHTNWLLAPLIWLCTVLFYNTFYQRNFRFHFDHETAWVESGVIGRDWVAIEWFKVHNVTLSSSPHQRRKNLCTLTVHTSGDKVTLPYIPTDFGRKIRDLAIWQINTNQRPWM